MTTKDTNHCVSTSSIAVDHAFQCNIEKAWDHIQRMANEAKEAADFLRVCAMQSQNPSHVKEFEKMIKHLEREQDLLIGTLLGFDENEKQILSMLSEIAAMFDDNDVEILGEEGEDEDGDEESNEITRPKGDLGYGPDSFE